MNGSRWCSQTARSGIERASTSSSYPSSLGNVVRSNSWALNSSAYARAIRPGVPRRLSVSVSMPEGVQQVGGGPLGGHEVDARRGGNHAQRQSAGETVIAAPFFSLTQTVFIRLSPSSCAWVFS